MELPSTKTLYILQLEDDCWYVGTTSDLNRRFRAHQEKTACAWTKKHAVIGIVEQMPCTSPLLEDFKTKELMQKYGIARVRGGSYCQVTLRPEQWQTLNTEFRTADNRCLNCGEAGHFVNNCPLKVKSPRPSRKPRKRTCSRCGRNTHDIRTCYAKTHLDGSSLEGVPYYKKEQDTEDQEIVESDSAEIEGTLSNLASVEKKIEPASLQREPTPYQPLPTRLTPSDEIVKPNRVVLGEKFYLDEPPLAPLVKETPSATLDSNFKTKTNFTDSCCIS